MLEEYQMQSAERTEVIDARKRKERTSQHYHESRRDEPSRNLQREQRKTDSHLARSVRVDKDLKGGGVVVTGCPR